MESVSEVRLGEWTGERETYQIEFTGTDEKTVARQRGLFGVVDPGDVQVALGRVAVDPTTLPLDRHAQ